MKEEKLSTKKKIVRILLVIIGLVFIIAMIYLVLKLTGLWESINSVEKIKTLILSLGFYGRLFFVVLQFLQVTFLPIPSTITTLAGLLIYGPLQTALLSLSGILLGSAMAFFLGRQFGLRLVVFMVGKDDCQKWIKFLSGAKYSFFIMMILPIFPDDILCLVAGLTDMTWAFFAVTNLISRPLAVFSTCFLGSGDIIPYEGWGIAVWVVLLIAMGIVLYLSFKYRKQIEGFLKKNFSKKHKNV